MRHRECKSRPPRTRLVVHTRRVDPTPTAVAVDTQHGRVLVAKGNGTAPCPQRGASSTTKRPSRGRGRAPGGERRGSSAQAPDTLLCSGDLLVLATRWMVWCLLYRRPPQCDSGTTVQCTPPSSVRNNRVVCATLSGQPDAGTQWTPISRQRVGKGGAGNQDPMAPRILGAIDAHGL